MNHAHVQTIDGPHFSVKDGRFMSRLLVDFPGSHIAITGEFSFHSPSSSPYPTGNFNLPSSLPNLTIRKNLVTSNYCQASLTIRKAS